MTTHEMTTQQIHNAEAAINAMKQAAADAMRRTEYGASGAKLVMRNSLRWAPLALDQQERKIRKIARLLEQGR